MKRFSLLLLALLVVFIPVVLSAQPAPATFTNLRTTDATATSACVGCPDGSTTPANDSGMTTASVVLKNATPSSTTNKLYNVGGALYFNGLGLATGSSISGTTGTVPKFTGSTALGDSNATISGTAWTIAGALTATSFTGTVATSNLSGNYVATVASGTGITSSVTSGTGAATTITLNNTAVTPSTYGSTTAISVFTVDQQGRITSATTSTPQLTLTSTYFSSLSGANLTGIVDAALTSNVALLNRNNQAWSARNDYTAAANNFGLTVTGSATSGQSLAMSLVAGTTTADYALDVLTKAGVSQLKARGDGLVIVPTGISTDTTNPGNTNARIAGTLAVVGNSTLSGSGNSVGTITTGVWNAGAVTATSLNSNTVDLTSPTVTATLFASVTSGLINIGNGSMTKGVTIGGSSDPGAKGLSVAGAIVATGTITGTLATAAQTNITSVGTLTGGATGAGFTVALSSSTITGSLADARLSSNVALLNRASQAWTARNDYTSPSGNFGMTITGDAGAGNSFALNLLAGTNTTDYALNVQTAAGAVQLRAYGDGLVSMARGVSTDTTNPGVTNFRVAGTSALVGNVTMSGTGNAVGTITSGTWNAGAVTASGNITTPSRLIVNTTTLVTHASGGVSIGVSTDDGAGNLRVNGGIITNGTIGSIGIIAAQGGLTVTNVNTTLTSAQATGAGDVYFCATTTKVVTFGATCGVSASRFKDNIVPLDHGLDWLRQITPSTFTYKHDKSAGVGVIADEIAAIDPRLAVFQGGQVFSVQDRALIAVTIKAIKELDDRLLKLEGK